MPAKSRASPTCDGHLTVPVPRSVNDAVAAAASKNLMSANSYIRGAVLAKLRADGFDYRKLRHLRHPL
jgi:predicted HicB family RNase H-like nuclease